MLSAPALNVAGAGPSVPEFDTTPEPLNEPTALELPLRSSTGARR